MAKRILVVDDEAGLVFLLKNRLHAQGFEVMTAGDGLECLEMLKESLPDLILLDIQMPRLDGFDTLRELKTQKRTQSIPVVMVSAKCDEADQRQARDLGASRFISKPFDAAQISKITHEFLPT